MQLPADWATKHPSLGDVLGFAYHCCRGAGQPDNELITAIRPFVDMNEVNWRLASLREIEPGRDYISDVKRRILERLQALPE